MYYKRLYNMFGSTELALAAYNAGPGIVKKYHRVPPYGETKYFVSKIMKEYNHQKSNPDPAIVKARNNKNHSKTIVSSKQVITKIEEPKAPSPVSLPVQGIV